MSKQAPPFIEHLKVVAATNTGMLASQKHTTPGGGRLRGSRSLGSLNSSGGFEHPGNVLSGYRRSELLARPKPYLTHPSAAYFRSPYGVAYEQLSKQRTLRLLESLFYEADEDNSQGVTLEEFRKCLQKQVCQKAFSRFGVQPHQAEQVYRALDKMHQGNLTIDKFMTGFIELLGDGLSDDQFELNIGMLKPGQRKKLGLDESSQAHVDPRKFLRTSSAPMMYPHDCFKRPLHQEYRQGKVLTGARPSVRCVAGSYGQC
jgi:Ca2+-binding EF-hand superfamily protein